MLKIKIIYRLGFKKQASWKCCEGREYRVCFFPGMRNILLSPIRCIQMCHSMETIFRQICLPVPSVSITHLAHINLHPPKPCHIDVSQIPPVPIIHLSFSSAIDLRVSIHSFCSTPIPSRPASTYCVPASLLPHHPTVIYLFSSSLLHTCPLSLHTGPHSLHCFTFSAPDPPRSSSTQIQIVNLLSF